MPDTQMLEELIHNHSMVLISFTGRACGACHAIKHKLDKILKKYPCIQNLEIDGEQYHLLAAHYQVFHLPLFILYIEGKETFRIGRNIDLLDFENKIRRYYELLEM